MGQGAERAMAEGRGMVAEAEVPRCWGTAERAMAESRGIVARGAMI